MKPKMIGKICIDLAMTLGLLFLMTYELIGQAAHEWLEQAGIAGKNGEAYGRTYFVR